MRRAPGTVFLFALLCGGCFATPAEVRGREPVYTRRGVGSASEATARCIQDYVENHYGGVVGRASGVAFEVRREDPTVVLIGRDWARPSLVVFVVSLIPASATDVEAQLRVAPHRFPGVQGAVIEATDVCVRPRS